MAVMPASEGADSDGFVLSVRESPGNGSGAGSDLFTEHWHGPPCEPKPPLQQHDPSAPQQLRCWAEGAAVLPQQECRSCDRAAQCGHFAAGESAARPDFISARCDPGLPQLQAITGRVSAGTDMAASHTRTFAVMLLQRGIASDCISPGQG